MFGIRNVNLLAANAFIAACILCGELNELKLPNCDNELRALRVAAVAALLLLLALLFDRVDSLDKLEWCGDDVVDDEEWFGNDVPPNPNGKPDAAAEVDEDEPECLLFVWLDFFDDEDELCVLEVFPK